MKLDFELNKQEMLFLWRAVYERKNKAKEELTPATQAFLDRKKSDLVQECNEFDTLNKIERELFRLTK